MARKSTTRLDPAQSRAFAEHLHQSERIERQRLKRDEEYELYQARARRRDDPEYPRLVQAIRQKYRALTQRVRQSYEAIRHMLPAWRRTRER